MANIKALLNPMADRKHEATVPQTPRSSPSTKDCSPGQSRKKLKLTKDVPVFTRGPIRGECRFPPDEYQDEELAAYHQQYEVYPMGEIADYPRHIPYNSEKKAFLEKTGREYLEVFQYNFKKPGNEQTFSMLWDYNIGLVRTTPLFKCMGHSKTTPAKMLSRNPGLKDICHSITGGALVAQGYWIPHAAAKAIAASFCYEIRHALTPVFGHDFPEICVKPGEDGFGDMTIDPAITEFCTERAAIFRAEERPITPHISTLIPGSSTPSTPTYSRRNFKKHKPARAVNNYTSPYLASPFMSDKSDSGSDDNYTISSMTPEPAYRNVFTSINTPRTTPRSVPYPERRLPSPREILSQNGYRSRAITELPSPPVTSSLQSSPAISPKTIPAQRVTLTPFHIKDARRLLLTEDIHLGPSLVSCIPEADTEAAYILLSMKLQKSPEEVAKEMGLTLPLYIAHNKKKRWGSA